MHTKIRSNLVYLEEVYFNRAIHISAMRQIAILFKCGDNVANPQHITKYATISGD